MFNHGKIAKSILAELAAEAPFPAFSGAAKQMGCASRACARDRKFIFYLPIH
jgi:hypothetical protein